MYARFFMLCCEDYTIASQQLQANVSLTSRLGHRPKQMLAIGKMRVYIQLYMDKTRWFLPW